MMNNAVKDLSVSRKQQIHQLTSRNNNFQTTCLNFKLATWEETIYGPNMKFLRF